MNQLSKTINLPISIEKTFEYLETLQLDKIGYVDFTISRFTKSATFRKAGDGFLNWGKLDLSLIQLNENETTINMTFAPTKDNKNSENMQMTVFDIFIRDLEALNTNTYVKGANKNTGCVVLLPFILPYLIYSYIKNQI
jgi:hypothetical protein